MGSERASERGQVVPLLLVALVFAAVTAAGLVRVGVAASERAAAQAAADATALAGAAEGERAAAELAEANAASLVRFVAEADDVEVTVRRGRVEATARARWQPVPIP